MKRQLILLFLILYTEVVCAAVPGRSRTCYTENCKEIVREIGNDSPVLFMLIFIGSILIALFVMVKISEYVASKKDEKQ